jgi:hypothetical protein
MKIQLVSILQEQLDSFCYKSMRTESQEDWWNYIWDIKCTHRLKQDLTSRFPGALLMNSRSRLSPHLYKMAFLVLQQHFGLRKIGNSPV